MRVSIGAFYDGLADTYHGLYPDWQAEAVRQGQSLHLLLSGADGWPGARDVADVACGIGTQLVGLCALGHQVRGSDVSPRAVARARRECAQRGLPAALCVADMRAIPWQDSCVDAVICADNALPHLLQDDQVEAAFTEMRRILRAGGIVLLSTRDYDQVLPARPTGTGLQLHEGPDERMVTFQVWHWRNSSDIYDLEHFQLVQRGSGPWQAQVRGTTLRAYTRAHLTSLAQSAGLVDITWPEGTGYFQPVMTARRR